MSAPPADLFQRAYLGRLPAAAGDTSEAAPLQPATDQPELAARTALAEPVALRGCVLGPDGPLTDGYVVVADGTIADVTAARPAGARVHDTGGVILPGLIDLHGHPEFNIFAAWEPPQRFANRYRWRGSPLYQKLIRDPQNALLTQLPPHTQLRYAEVRALIGGVTAIQGASGARQSADESLVRNVDLRVFGGRRARSMIDLPSGASSQGQRSLDATLAAITARTVDAFYVHLAEGLPDDPRTGREFDKLVALNALTRATIVVHGTALTRDQLDAIAQQGRGLVWSPQSNLRLYGRTTDAATAIERGVPVALGADWLPTGSTSLLAEMKVARRQLAAQRGAPVPAEELVRMVTFGAAAIAGLGDKLGTLAPGRPADLVVLERHAADPYENVCLADPSWVDLVMVGGDLAYGRADWVRALAADPDRPSLEPVTAWGTPMLLDTSFHAGTLPAGGRPAGTPITLTDLRTALTDAYPQVGPIFA
jgi:cytosine/adenosine deaminase-related metal-dependent hydrolase